MYQISEELEQIAAEVLRLCPDLEANNATIAYMQSDKAKRSGNKKIYADCHKIGDRESVLCGYDFIITFYRDSIGITPEATDLLMLHELLHVGCDESGRKRIVPHDLEDFRQIVEEHGVNWIES